MFHINLWKLSTLPFPKGPSWSWSYGGVIYNYICHILLKYNRPSWSWSYGGVIYNYICHALLKYKGPSWSLLYGGVIYNSLYYAISVYHHLRCEFESRSWRGVLVTTLCDKVCQWLETGQWFFCGFFGFLHQ